MAAIGPRVRLCQSLGWVERLSDSIKPKRDASRLPFQSLGWVERLSDQFQQQPEGLLLMFQSLGWVERLSDRVLATN